MASVTKTHDTWSAGQFLTGNLAHFTITSTAAIVIKHLVETTSMRATVVLLGDAGARIAVENNGAWSALSLSAALSGQTEAEWTADVAPVFTAVALTY